MKVARLRNMTLFILILINLCRLVLRLSPHIQSCHTKRTSYKAVFIAPIRELRRIDSEPVRIDTVIGSAAYRYEFINVKYMFNFETYCGGET